MERGAGADEHPWESLKGGLRFVFTTPIMVWTTGLDFVATFFAGSLSLLPIFADQVLHAGASGYGWLVAAPALGALLGSLYTSTVHLPRRQGHVFLWAVVALRAVHGGLGPLLPVLPGVPRPGRGGPGRPGVHGHPPDPAAAHHPRSLRGRMTSVNMIFFMGGPQLGEVEAGLVASLFASAALGVRVAVVSGGILTAAAALYVYWRSRLVREYQLPPAVSP